MIFDVTDEQEDDSIDVDTVEPIDELSGKMRSDLDEERLMHSVIENDEQTITDGKMLSESVDYAMGSFTPDLMFKNIVQNYKNAQRLYGPTIIRELTGYGNEFVEKNLKMSEFREEIRQNIEKNVKRLKDEGLLDDEGQVTNDGMKLASIVMYTEELDHLETHGLGKKDLKEKSHYGERSETVRYTNQRYKDINIRGSVMRAIRRGHSQIEENDLRAFERIQHGKISIVYALDASGSMRGKKISTAKKAGVALAFKAIQDRNDVGLLVFTNEVLTSIPPTKDFSLLLEALANTRAGHETDIALSISHAIKLFENGAHTKHLIILTDAIPTTGKDPLRTTLETASMAKDCGITISIIGINLEKEGERLAREIVQHGNGKLYKVNALEELDTIILEDYENLKR